jgi:hypothetical protein
MVVAKGRMMHTSHELEGHGNSVLIVGHVCGGLVGLKGRYLEGRLVVSECEQQKEVAVVFGRTF